jgi:hypothetical protein
VQSDLYATEIGRLPSTEIGHQLPVMTGSFMTVKVADYN